jgi:hypothetical protein
VLSELFHADRRRDKARATAAFLQLLVAEAPETTFHLCKSPGHCVLRKCNLVLTQSRTEPLRPTAALLGTDKDITKSHVTYAHFLSLDITRNYSTNNYSSIQSITVSSKRPKFFIVNRYHTHVGRFPRTQHGLHIGYIEGNIDLLSVECVTAKNCQVPILMSIGT